MPDRMNYPKDAGPRWRTNSLQSLNFSIDGSSLLLNGHQILPHASEMVTTNQRRVSDGKLAESIPLGYVLEELPVVSSTGEKIDLYNVRFTVIDLDHHPVPMNTVLISLTKEPDGNLTIVSSDIESTAPDTAPWKQCRGKISCWKDLLFDRIRDLLAATKSRITDLRSKLSSKVSSKPKGMGCHGGARPPPPTPDGGKADPHPGEKKLGQPSSPDNSVLTTEEKGPSGNAAKVAPQENHDGSLHGPPQHQTQAKWQHVVFNLVRFTLIPFAVGMVAGLIAIAVGTVVGSFIVMMWQRYRRSTRAEAHTEEGLETEKQGLMGFEEQELTMKKEEEEEEDGA